MRRSKAYNSIQDYEKAKGDLDRILLLEPAHSEAAGTLK